MRPETRTAAFLAPVLLLLGALAAAVPASAAADCLGQPLTLPVGTSTGTPARDVMLGTSADETINGLGGNDIICGGGGADAIYGGPGRDNLVGGRGADRLYGQGGCDYLRGGLDDDLLVPGAGEPACVNTADGEGGRDRIIIDKTGRHDAYGGPGRDTLDFRKAPGGVTVDLRDHWYEFASEASVHSYVQEIEVVFGSQFADHLWGTDLRDTLKGFGGDDWLHGRDGDDTLIGGDGQDTVDGFNGHDVCEGENLQLCND